MLPNTRVIVKSDMWNNYLLLTVSDMCHISYNYMKYTTITYFPIAVHAPHDHTSYRTHKILFLTPTS